MLLDIVILPPTEIRNLVGKAMVKSVGDFKCKYIIDNKRLIPHASFFHININKQKLPVLLKIVRSNLTSYKPVMVFFEKVLTDGKGIFISLSNHKSLINFNHKMAEVCAPLRNGMIPWIPKRLPTKLEKYNREKYGTHYSIGEGFKPHFTMAKLRSEAEARIVCERMKFRKFSFLANTVAVCQINKYGQVTRVVKKFKL